MTDNPTPRRPAELAAALTARTDGDRLGEVWDALPGISRTVTEADAARQRDAAWARLQATLRDPNRVPYSEDVLAGPSLVDPGELDNEGTLPGTVPASTRASAPNSRSAGHIPGIPTRVSRRWLIAASVLVAAGVGVVGARAIPVTYQTDVATSPAAPLVSAVRLADGSDVWLAPGSRLRAPRALGWPGWLRASGRDFTLSGRAFFAVRADGRPFTVHTGDARIRVLGTQFEVRSETGAAGTQVTVEEGHVAVSAAQSRTIAWPAVELRAGQRTVVGGPAGAAAVREVPAARIAGWRTGGLSALDEPLDAVLEELARRFNVEITHAANIDGRDSVSLFYPTSPSVETVLSDLSTAQGFVFRRTSRGFHITRNGTRP